MDKTSKADAPAPSKAPVPDKQAGPLFAQGFFVLLAALLVYSFVTVAKEGELRRRCAPTCLLHPEYAGANRSAPDFALKDMNGKEVRLSDYRGKVVFLNFWTKTCGPCMEEMPDIAELAHIVSGRKDVAVLTVSTDEGPDDVRAALKSVLREDPPFPILFDPDFKVVKDKYGTTLYPETYLIDKNGIIRSRFDGSREWTSGMVKELLDQLRTGGYCPIDIHGGQRTGPAAKICDEI
ncbi:MAG: TlpA disulfide reductase family protein [Polyangiaceae bacterium]